MKCRNCGANIEENSKFCENCGVSVIVPEEKNEDVVIRSEDLNVDNLGKTMRIEPIIVAEQSDMTVGNETQFDSMVNNTEFLEQQPTVQVNTTSVLEQQPTVQNNPIPVMNQQPTKTRKNNKLIYIIGGVVLAVVAVVLVLFAFMKSSESSVTVLKNALANFNQTASNSATVNAKLSMSATTGENFEFSATVKAQKKSDNEMNLLVKINKSLLFEEMSAYVEVTKKEMTAYIESTLIDLLGMTSSTEPMWVYYTLPFEQLIDESTVESANQVELESLIDNKHFVFVSNESGLNRYQLIIDQELIDNIKGKFSELEGQDAIEEFETMEPLTNPINIDFYINELNELKKIQLDMASYFGDISELSSLVLSLEFSELNNTVVEIPSEAKKSIYDLEGYMIDYSINYGFDYNTEYYDNSYEIGM